MSMCQSRCGAISFVLLCHWSCPRGKQESYINELLACIFLYISSSFCRLDCICEMLKCNIYPAPWAGLQLSSSTGTATAIFLRLSSCCRCLIISFPLDSWYAYFTSSKSNKISLNYVQFNLETGWAREIGRHFFLLWWKQAKVNAIKSLGEGLLQFLLCRHCKSVTTDGCYSSWAKCEQWQRKCKWLKQAIIPGGISHIISMSLFCFRILGLCCRSWQESG